MKEKTGKTAPDQRTEETGQLNAPSDLAQEGMLGREEQYWGNQQI